MQIIANPFFECVIQTLFTPCIQLRRHPRTNGGLLGIEHTRTDVGSGIGQLRTTHRLRELVVERIVQGLRDELHLCCVARTHFAQPRMDALPQCTEPLRQHWII